MASKPIKFSLLDASVTKLARMTDEETKARKAKDYGHRWQLIRAAHLARQPLCVHCLARGVTTAATQVDHIQRLRMGGTNHPSNLQSLCARCHAKKSNAERKQQ